jgi:hypothetical protein
MDHLITGDELKRLSGGARIMTYEDLSKYDNIDDAFPRNGKIALLYINEKGPSGTVGHWTSMIKRDNTIECSDPYNYRPDHQFDKIRKTNGQEPGLLSSLLIDHIDRGGKVTYNEKAVQSKDNSVATCGRHVGCRLYFANVPLPEFQKQMQRIKSGGRSTDDFVVDWSKSKIGV